MQTKLIPSAILAASMLYCGSAAAADDLLTAMFTPFRQKEVRPVDNKSYQVECGSCHFAYPAGLLPANSWDKLLNEKALAHHFGENAQLDQGVLTEIREYALANAADQSYWKRARKIAVATKDIDPPLLRITQVRYIKRKHQDIPENLIQGNKDVKSLSYCDACHTQAKDGVFDADTVLIPSHPEWSH